MKQTAVEWLADNVLSYKNPTNINGTDYILIPINKVEYLRGQAKEMEKEIAHQYAEFAIQCDRKELPVLEFDGWISL